MRRLLAALRSHIRYKIVLPYLALTLVVMMAGSAIGVGLVAASWEERLTNQLASVARNTSEALVRRERNYIDFLRQVAFAIPDPESGTPGAANAFSSADPAVVANQLELYYKYGISNPNLDFDRMIAFDKSGKTLVDWQRVVEDPNAEPFQLGSSDLSDFAVVQRVVSGTTVNGNDKFSGLIQFESDPQPLFYTVVPVKQGTTVVGGVMIGTKVDRLTVALEKSGQAAVTTFYNLSGQALGSTLISRQALSSLQMSEQMVNLLSSGQAQSIFNIDPLRGSENLPVWTLPIQQREYELAYSPLVIAGEQAGYFSVGLSRDFQVESLSLSRNTILGIAMALAVGSILLGYAIARGITRPLAALVETAEAVTAGDFERRTDIGSADELGRLARAFNLMTEHLLRLYHTSRELSTSIEVGPVLDVTAKTVQGFAPGTEVLALLDERGVWRYQLRPDAPPELAALQNLRLSPSDPLLRELVDAHIPRLIAPAEEPRLGPTGLADIAGFTRVLLTPLVVQGTPAGVLIFGHKQPDAFDGAIEPTLLSVANMAASVLYNAVLFDRIHEEAGRRQAILQSIADGVIVCDQQRNIMLVNSAAEQMLNMRDWHIVRRNFNEVPFKRVDAQKDIFGRETPVLEHYQFGDRVLRLSSAPVITENGQVFGEVIVLHDISAEVAVDRAKTKFIETVSHELRTPLTPICGNTELLLRGYIGELSSDQRDLLEVVRMRAEQMRDLVNNFVMIASIEANTLQTEPEPQDVWVAIENAVAPLRNSFAKKGLDLRVEMPDELPLVVADREQLRVILTQLLDNARRYTQQGAVTVRVIHANGTVQIDVIDTGPGISQAEFGNLFTRFHRIEGNNSPERGGGLGLVITRQLVERQGGRVWVTSEVGHGSTFSFSLLVANEHADAVAGQDNADTAA